jgi:heptaprenyl diphosphate synthase
MARPGDIAKDDTAKQAGFSSAGQNMQAGGMNGMPRDDINGTDRSVALLGALCLFFSGLEYVIPKPLPFMRIGLANIPLLLALDIFPLKQFALLVLLKVLGQALITGTLFSYVFLFSLAGTISSAVCMYFFRRKAGPGILSFTGIGVLGALVSNACQLALARLFIFGEGTKYLIPPLFLAGLVSGAGLGLFCEAFADRSRWYRRQCRELLPGRASYIQSSPDGCRTSEAGIFCPGSLENPVENLAEKTVKGPTKKNTAALQENTETSSVCKTRTSRQECLRQRRRKVWEKTFRSSDLFIAALVMIPFFLLNSSILWRSIQFLLFWLFSFLCGKKNRPLVTLLIIAVIVLFNLQSPYGKVLADFGFFRITQGSLISGIHKALNLEGLIMLSHAGLSRNVRIPGAFGKLLGASLAMFEHMSERRHIITRQHPIEGIDTLLLELSCCAEDQTPSPARRSPLGVCLILLAVLLIAGLTILPRSLLRFAHKTL